MRLDSESLAVLRDQLRLRGERPSMVPGPISSLPPDSPRAPLTADALAVVQRVSPMCEVLYLLMVADDRHDPRENEVLRGAVRALTDGALRSHEIDDMLGVYAARLQEESRQDRLEQVTAQLALDRSDAEAAYTLAAAMVIADERPDQREKAMLEELRDLLAISRARAHTLLGEVLDPPL